MKNKKGFTLIELLIVIAIIGLLATLAIVSLTSAQRSARDTKRIADLKALQTSLELYYNQNADYPIGHTAWVGAAPTSFETSLSAFISATPTDPGNNLYKYYVPDNLDPSSYYLVTQLEDTGHDSLAQDNDDTFTATAATEWVASDDTTGAGIGAANNLDCLDATGFYCLAGQASP